MFLVGGFVTVHRSYCEGDACGDVDAGGYREYLSDVWYWDLNVAVEGDDGQRTRKRIPLAQASPGEAGIRYPCSRCSRKTVWVCRPRDALWVIGGDGSADDKSRDAGSTTRGTPRFPCTLAVGTIPRMVSTRRGRRGRYVGVAERVPRRVRVPGAIGPATVVDLPSSNLFTQRVYVIGGEGQDGSLLGDVWSTGWGAHDGQQAGSRTKVPTAAATDTVNEPSRGVWRGFCTSKMPKASARRATRTTTLTSSRPSSRTAWTRTTSTASRASARRRTR